MKRPSFSRRAEFGFKEHDRISLVRTPDHHGQLLIKGTLPCPNQHVPP